MDSEVASRKVVMWSAGSSDLNGAVSSDVLGSQGGRRGGSPHLAHAATHRPTHRPSATHGPAKAAFAFCRLVNLSFCQAYHFFISHMAALPLATERHGPHDVDYRCRKIALWITDAK